MYYRIVLVKCLWALLWGSDERERPLGPVIERIVSGCRRNGVYSSESVERAGEDSLPGLGYRLTCALMAIKLMGLWNWIFQTVKCTFTVPRHWGTVMKSVTLKLPPPPVDLDFHFWIKWLEEKNPGIDCQMYKGVILDLKNFPCCCSSLNRLLRPLCLSGGRTRQSCPQRSDVWRVA